MIEKVLTAFRNLNFNLLEIILDNDNTYMGVSKNTFIDRIQEKFENYYEDIDKTYDEILKFELITSIGYYKQQSFAFISEELPTLKITVFWNEDSIIDIQLAYYLEVKQDPHYGNWTFYFRFYEDEKLNFIPTNHFIEITQIGKTAIQEFDVVVKDDIIGLEKLKMWFTKYESFAANNDVASPLGFLKYKSLVPFEKLYQQVDNFIRNINWEKHSYVKLSEDSGITVEVY